MKIGLIQGNGKDLVGGGSIQLEYNLWANTQEDIEITNFIRTENLIPKEYDKLMIEGRILNNVKEFNSFSSHSIFNEMDKIIVLTYPFASSFESDSHKERVANWLLNAMNEFQRCPNKWWGVICYDYLKEVVLDNLGAHYIELYLNADKVWVNNRNNPLIAHLKSHGANDSLFHIECPQFMVDYKYNWLSPKDKYMNLIYYQGRSLKWKGWQYLPIFIKKLHLHDRNYKAILNGISNDEEVVTSLDDYFDSNKEEASRFDFDSLYEYHIKKENPFSHEVNVFGHYSPKNAHETTKRVGFSFYFTILEPQHNFFPEYAMIDAIRNGSVLIVPEWYFDNSQYPFKALDYEDTVIKTSPEEVGMIAYNPEKMLSNEEYKRSFYNLMEELKNNENLYNQYRQRAYDYMMKTHGANIVIRKFLNSN